jgi:hypothetical protein
LPPVPKHFSAAYFENPPLTRVEGGIFLTIIVIQGIATLIWLAIPKIEALSHEHATPFYF